jgi:ketosteroid isomerase-like protein
VLDDELRDRIRTSFEAFFAGDLDAAGAFMAEDILGIDAAEMPDAAEHHGREAMKARLAGFRELFEDIELRDIAIDEVGAYALVVIRVHGRAASTDIPVDMELAYLLDVEEGCATRLRAFLSEAAARAYIDAG